MPVGGNYVDLSPGMRLRVEAGGYDFVAPSSAWNSFSAAGGVTCAVARSSGQDVCFDAFLANGATSTTLGSPAWVGNLADLVGLGPRRHFRLVLPRTTPGPTQTSAAPAYGQTPALIGADNWTDLTSATNAYFAGGTCAPATSGRPVICAAFSGRPVVVPEILVQFLGQWLYLPVGSTVQHLLDLNHPLLRLLVPQSSSLYVNRLALAGLDPAAVFGPTLVSIPPPTQYVNQPEGGQLSQWDVPLMPGDTLIAPWSGS
jgi:hypothetical protein